MIMRPRGVWYLFSPTLLFLLVSCSSGSEETAKTYIQTVTNACSQSGGSVSTNGSQNCDYQAVVSSSAGSTIDSTDTASKTAIDAANTRVSDKCEAAAQLASVQCKFDKLTSDTATCQKMATDLIQTVSSHTGAQKSGASDNSSGSLFSTLLSSAQKSSNGADCSDAFKNAYMTYMTALNGSLANSQEGCAILEANLGKVLKSYQGRVDGGGLLALTQMGEALGSGSGSCPANTVMKLIYSQLGSSSAASPSSGGSASLPPVQSMAPSSTKGLIRNSVEASPATGPSAPGPKESPSIPSSLRSHKDKNYHNFLLVY